MKEELMQDWEVCNQAIPRGMRERVAQTLKLSADYIRRWCREPLYSETARADGFYSPLSRFLDFLDAVFLVSRDGAALIVNYVNARYHRLAYPESPVLTLNGLNEMNRAGSQLMQQCAQAVASMAKSENGINRDAYFNLIQLKQRTEEILACASQDLLRAEEPVQSPMSNVQSPAFGGGR